VFGRIIEQNKYIADRSVILLPGRIHRQYALGQFSLLSLFASFDCPRACADPPVHLRNTDDDVEVANRLGAALAPVMSECLR